MVKLSALKGIRGQYRLRVRYRRLVLEYATLHGPTAAARRYGVCPRTVCRWRRRWRAEGLAGLTPRYPRQRPSRLRPEVLGHIHHARETLHSGAARTRRWLLRVHQVRLAMGTIQRVFRALGLPYLRRTRKRAPRQLKLFEKAEPGESVQVDVKFVISVLHRLATRVTDHHLFGGTPIAVAIVGRAAGHNAPSLKNVKRSSGCSGAPAGRAESDPAKFAAATISNRTMTL